jgi:hypothetical protein
LRDFIEGGFAAITKKQNETSLEAGIFIGNGLHAEAPRVPKKANVERPTSKEKNDSTGGIYSFGNA